MMIGRVVACWVMVLAVCVSGAEPVFKAGRDTILDWKGLPSKLKVYLPTDYSPDKKHPCIFFYPGTSGSPDTRFMRSLTGGKTYVIVGMEYHIRGKIQLPPKEIKEYQANNMKTYKAVRKYLEERIAIDPKRVFLSGVSKGGWITSLQGEQEMK